MSRGATARLFVAVDPPAAVRERARRRGRARRRSRRVERTPSAAAPARSGVAAPDAVLPRQPPGRRDRGDRLRRSSACASDMGELSLGRPAVASAAPPARAGGRGPRRRGALASLQRRSWRRSAAAIDWRAASAGASAPHVTLARRAGVRRGRLPSAGARSARHAAAALHAESITLYRSWLVARGREL